MKGMTPTEIDKNMTETLKNSGLSFASVKRWVYEIWSGQESLDEEHRSGRTGTVSTEDNMV